ncbi:MAG: CBS domain-containing protein, partial [Bacteroidota bacterium]
MLTKTMLSPLCVQKEDSLIQVLERTNEAVQQGHPAGIALVVDAEGKLIGTITDGDIRRASVRHRSFETTAGEVMNADPITFPDHYTIKDVLETLPKVLEAKGRKSERFLSKVVLVDADKRPTRILEYHQLWEQRV